MYTYILERWDTWDDYWKEVDCFKDETEAREHFKEYVASKKTNRSYRLIHIIEEQ